MQSESKTYPWKRLWYPRGGTIDLSDSGFLVDPETEYAKYVHSDAVPFNKIDHFPCLALLGEAGIGKSTAMENIRAELEETIKSTDNQVLYLNLNEYGDEYRLIKDIFECKLFRAWIDGDHILHLLLDSLDECKIQILKAGRILANQFRNHKDRLERLRVRISCRAADWSEVLEQSLPELWGKDNFSAYILAPLLRKDVGAALEAESLDARQFFSELERTEATPLAIKPITLKFLLSAFQNHGRFPKSKIGLYEIGCKRLCEEQNPDRRDLGAIGMGNLTVDERLTIASRIAAIVVFCNKHTIFTGSSIEMNDNVEVTFSMLAGLEEGIGSTQLVIKEDSVREVLGTGLFTPRGAGMMGFAHQTYAEYLASRYLRIHSVEADKVLALLRHPGDPTERITPQLYETAAWIAGRDKEVFKAIANNDPQVLLRSDAEAYTEEDRAMIVHTILETLHSRQDIARGWDIRTLYSKLKHNNLANQLRCWVIDKSKHEIARYNAIDIAHACNIKELQRDLVSIGLDHEEQEDLRVRAIFTLSQIGDSETRGGLRTIALGQTEGDPSERIKGCALLAVWPDHITASELFENLTLPKSRYGVSFYTTFIGGEIVKHLKVSDLPIALRWLATKVEHILDRFYGWQLADDLMIKAWDHMDDPGIFLALVDTCIGFFNSYKALVHDEEKANRNSTLFNDSEKRRRLAKAIIYKSNDRSIRFELGNTWPHLIRIDDFDWCIQELTSCISQPLEARWAELVWFLFHWAGRTPSQCDSILELRKKSDHLRNESDSFFSPVRLGSSRARKMRRAYKRKLKRQRKEEPKLLDWLPKDRIEHILNRIEKGEYSLWWILIREMTLEDTSTDYYATFETDITKLPGWQNSDYNTRSRILEAAIDYLNSLEPFEEEPLYEGKGDTGNESVFQAFLLLMNLRFEVLEVFNATVWSHWVPVFFLYGVGDEKEAQKNLIYMAYKKVPDRVVNVSSIFIHHQLWQGTHSSALEIMEGIWDRRIRDTIYGMLGDAGGKPYYWGQLLAALVRHNDSDAVKLAKEKLKLPLPQENIEKEFSKHAALVLVSYQPDASWSLIWPVIQEESNFGRDLVTKIAQSRIYNFSGFISKLKEMEIADLYILLIQEFPFSEHFDYSADSPPPEGHSIVELRSSLLSFLKNSGTPTSCKAIEHITEGLPEIDWLKSVLVEARQNALRQTWIPLQPDELIKITSQPGYQLVRNASELQELLVEKLNLLEHTLQGETPAAIELWDNFGPDSKKKKFRPKDENDFSDWVKRNLAPELKTQGIVVAREVEIRRGTGSGTGQSTDIHVTAIVPGIASDTFDQVRVIIETKGCWHAELQNAMKTQLVDRYLEDNQCRHGIYLVGWFNCDHWADEDDRKNKPPKWSIQEARDFFTDQAEELSTPELSIKAVVINTTLR